MKQPLPLGSLPAPVLLLQLTWTAPRAAPNKASCVRPPFLSALQVRLFHKTSFLGALPIGRVSGATSSRGTRTADTPESQNLQLMSLWYLGTAVELKLGAFEILSALVTEKPNSQTFKSCSFSL